MKNIKETTIKKYIWNYIRDNYSSEIEEYKKHLKEFEIKLNLKEEIIETVLQGYDENHYGTELLNGSDENDMDMWDRVTRFRDEVEDQDLDDLIKYMDKEEEIFWDRQYIDSDWIMEDIMHEFKWDKKDYDKYTNYCDSYQGSLHLTNKYFEGINSFNQEYRNKNDIEEHLAYNFDLIETMNMILIENYKGYDVDYKEFRKEISNTKTKVKEELEKRLKEFNKEKNTILKELKLVDCNNIYLVGLIESDLASKNIEIKSIIEVLK